MFLLDTNVVSEMRRPSPDRAVRAWVESMRPEDQLLSAVSLLEILRGATRHPDIVQQHAIQHWIDSTLRVWFEARILPISIKIAEDAGILMGTRERAGQPISLSDAFIAAKAIDQKAVLVTRNTKDFIHLPLDVFDPWTNKLTLGEKRR